MGRSAILTMLAGSLACLVRSQFIPCLVNLLQLGVGLLLQTGIILGQAIGMPNEYQVLICLVNFLGRGTGFESQHTIVWL